MSPSDNSRSKVNLARRHFLGVSAAAGARVAAITGAAAAITAPSAAWSFGRNWGKHGGSGKGNGAQCFLRGTAIATSAGEVVVERLQIGDLVETLEGGLMSVKWIGQRSFNLKGPHRVEDVMPIRVRRHALCSRTPHSDLYLSPGHALFIDGALIRVKDLVNGSSISPALPERCVVIEYFHILLDSHQVIRAEGALSESFLLNGHNHESFTNFADLARLHPGITHSQMEPAAPTMGYAGRNHLRALLRIGANLVRRRKPIYDVYDRIAARAHLID